VVRFDCTAKFKNKKVDGQLIAQQQFKSSPAKATLFATAKKLFKANSAQLPPDNTWQPKIVKVGPNALDQSVVTTDFFWPRHFRHHNRRCGALGRHDFGASVIRLESVRLVAHGPKRYVAAVRRKNQRCALRRQPRQA